MPREGVSNKGGSAEEDEENRNCSQLNNDLHKIADWSDQWKLSFNPDISKQAVEAHFSTKIKYLVCNQLIFNNSPVKVVGKTKHLGMILERKLSFESHVKEKNIKGQTGFRCYETIMSLCSTSDLKKFTNCM